jgi:DNA-binding LacI/PurR family transcriptional regulator
LTTIKQPISLMGEKAVEGLVTMMQENSSNPENIELPVELIERKST